MASLIESVRKLHGPHVVAHDNGYDVDVICDECTRLRLEALDQAAGDGQDLSYSAESVRVPYPCNTRIIAGTTAVEGKEEAARMRLERLVVQREEIEEQIERLDAVIALIRRDLGEESAGEVAPEPDDALKVDEKRATKRSKPVSKAAYDTSELEDDTAAIEPSAQPGEAGAGEEKSPEGSDEYEF